jgi:hypothetical protein
VTFWDKARQAAAAAAVTAKETAGVAGAGVKGAAGIAKTSASAAVDRINPNTLADLVIKATIIQERTNAALREKGSAYRIAEIAITAAFPPEISFSIARIGDVDGPEPWQQPAAADAWQPPAEPWQPPPSAEPGWGVVAGVVAGAVPTASPAEPRPAGAWPPPEGWQEATEGWEAVEPARGVPPEGAPPE